MSGSVIGVWFYIYGSALCVGVILKSNQVPYSEKTSKREKTSIVYYPFSNFLDEALYKDTGGYATSLSKLGYDSHLIVGKLSCHPPEGVTVHCTGNLQFNKASSYFLEIMIVLKLFDKIKPKVIVFFPRNPLNPLFTIYMKFSKLLFKSKNVKLILKLDTSGESGHLSASMRLAQRLLFLSMQMLYDLILIETGCAFETLSRMVKNKKIRVVRNGYSDKAILLPERNVNREQIVLSVSRIVKEKGVHLLIKSYYHAIQKFPEWKLAIVGYIQEPEYFYELQKLVAELKLDDRVTFLGSIPQNTLRDLMVKSGIFCLLSLRESFGIVRAEAIASGIPMITSTAGCGIEFSKCGSLIVPIGDIKASSNAMIELMADKTLRESISESQFGCLRTWDDSVKEMLCFIHS